MEHTEIGHEPESVLHLPELDVELVQALARHWLVTVEQRGDGIVMQLYAREWQEWPARMPTMRPSKASRRP